MCHSSGEVAQRSEHNGDVSGMFQEQVGAGRVSGVPSQQY